MKGRSENSFFDNLFRNNFNKVVSYLYLYSRDRELSENIAQDAFMALWENIEGVNEEKALGYVYTAARNKLINNFSKTMTSCRYNDYCRLKTVSLMRSVMESDTMHKIYGNEIESRLVDAMDRMNDKVRETFELSRFNGKRINTYNQREMKG